MTFAADILSDYTVFDGLEAVTLEKPGTTATVSVASALRRAVSTKEAAASGGRYTTADVVWHIPIALAVAQPALGDRIKDAASTRFTILGVEKNTLSSRWRCLSRDLAVANRLDCFISIYRARTSKGVGGAAERDWEEYRTGVRARIQELESQVTVENELRTTVATHAVYMETDGDQRLDESHRIVDEAGNAFHVLGWRLADDLGLLMVVDVSKSPFPLGEVWWRRGSRQVAAKPTR